MSDPSPAGPAADAPLRVERRGAVALVTLDRPGAMNALNAALRQGIADAFNALDRDPEVRAVVLTGEGERAFCAGLDLKELGQAPRAAAAGRTRRTDPVRAIEACSKPVIAAVNGVAVTGGLELALACDVVLASEAARFADTHARVGILPGWGLSQRLPRLIGTQRAKLMSFSGRYVDARTACDWGLVAQLHAPRALLEAALDLAQDIAGADRDFIARLKGVIDDGFAGTFADGLALESARNADWNAAQTPEALAERREAVIARGRAQSGARRANNRGESQE
ncbi:MAG: enoyl-CoA hydratase [Pseudomonadota bacterium]